MPAAPYILMRLVYADDDVNIAAVFACREPVRPFGRIVSGY